MFLAGTPIVLDPAGALYAAIGTGNLRAFTDGTDTVGRDGLANEMTGPLWRDDGEYGGHAAERR